MSLRDLLVTAIVVGTLPFVLAHAYIGVLLWTWISVMNPHKLAWGFAMDMPFAAMAAVATLISLITTRDRVQLPRDGVVTVLVLFVAWTSLTTLMAIDPQDSWIQLEKVFKIQLMTLVAMAALMEKRHILLFVWVNVLSLGFFGLKGGIYTIAQGGTGRVWGPPGGFIEGNNELGLAMIMAVPLMYFLWLTAESVWTRRGLIVLMLLSAVSVLGTQSRGGFLAIAAMTLFLWWRSPRKLKFGVPLLLAAIGLVLFMPESWVERMETIRNYEQDSSAMGRINAWTTMLNVANHRLFGAGFGMYNLETFLLYAPPGIQPIAAHSIYFQVLGEHGWIGLALFLALWIMVWRKAAALRRATKGRAEYRWVYHLAGMSQVSLIGYAVGGAFLSLAYFDLPYNILVVVVVLQRWLAEQIAAGSEGPGVASARSAGQPARGDARA